MLLPDTFVKYNPFPPDREQQRSWRSSLVPFRRHRMESCQNNVHGAEVVEASELRLGMMSRQLQSTAGNNMPFQWCKLHLSRMVLLAKTYSWN